MIWSWLSLLVGLLAGWLIEWLGDVLFWRRRYQAMRRENADLKARLAETVAHTQELQGQVDGYRGQLAEAEAASETMRSTLYSAEAKLEELTGRLHAVRAKRRGAKSTTGGGT